MNNGLDHEKLAVEECTWTFTCISTLTSSGYIASYYLSKLTAVPEDIFLPPNQPATKWTTSSSESLII